MILLLQNIQSSLYAIFEQSHVKYSFGVTALILSIFAILDAPFIYFIAAHAYRMTCDYIVCAFALLFVILSYSTFRVIVDLNKLARRTGFNLTLKSEKNTLIAMLILFDFSYLLRVILGSTILKKAYSGQYDTRFAYLMATLCPAVFLDALPLLFVIAVHHKSFSTETKEIGVSSNEDEYT